MNPLACPYPALAGCVWEDAACQAPAEAAGSRGEESHIPQHTVERWPWGPGSPSPPLAALLCICLLQCGVQLSSHLSPSFGSGQKLLPLLYSHSPPPLKYQLACSPRGVAC